MIGIEVKESWFKEKNEKTNLKEQSNKNNLYRNIISRIVIVWTIFILSLYIITTNIDELEIRTISLLFILIYIYIIIYIPKSIKRLKILFRYTRKEICEIEENVKNLDKEKCFPDIYMFEDFLVKLENAYFEIIKYEDIEWILKEIYYTRRKSEDSEFDAKKFKYKYKNYGEFLFITKDKKIHKMGFINKEAVFIKKILEKKSNILIGRSKTVIKKAKELYKLDIRYIDFRHALKSKILFLIIIIFFLF